MAFARRRTPYPKRSRKTTFRKRAVGRKRKRTTVRRRTTRKGGFRGRGNDTQPSHNKYTRGVGNTVKVFVERKPRFKRIDIPVDYTSEDVASLLRNIATPIVGLFADQVAPGSGYYAQNAADIAVVGGHEIWKKYTKPLTEFGEWASNTLNSLASNAETFNNNPLAANGLGDYFGIKNPKRATERDLIHLIMTGAHSAHSIGTMQRNSNVKVPDKSPSVPQNNNPPPGWTPTNPSGSEHYPEEPEDPYNLPTSTTPKYDPYKGWRTNPTPVQPPPRNVDPEDTPDDWSRPNGPFDSDWQNWNNGTDWWAVNPDGTVQRGHQGDD